MNRRQEQIVQCWKAHEDSEPDISTERLFAMVSDDTGADIDEIASALAASGLKGEAQ